MLKNSDSFLSIPGEQITASEDLSSAAIGIRHFSRLEVRKRLT
jgi:hypothetical protein